MPGRIRSTVKESFIRRQVNGPRQGTLVKGDINILERESHLGLPAASERAEIQSGRSEEASWGVPQNTRYEGM